MSNSTTPRTPDDDIREGQVSRRQSVPEMLDAPKRPFAPTQPARAHLAERVVTDPAALPAALDDETRIPASGRFAETIPAIPEPTERDYSAYDDFCLAGLYQDYHQWRGVIRLLAAARRERDELRRRCEAMERAGQDLRDNFLHYSDHLPAVQLLCEDWDAARAGAGEDATRRRVAELEGAEDDEIKQPSGEKRP